MSLGFDPNQFFQEHLQDPNRSSRSGGSNDMSGSAAVDPLLEQMESDMALMMDDGSASEVRNAMTSLLSSSSTKTDDLSSRNATVPISRLERLDHNIISSSSRPTGSRNGRKPHTAKNPFDTLVPKEIVPAALPMSIIPSATCTSASVLAPAPAFEPATRSAHRAHSTASTHTGFPASGKLDSRNPIPRKKSDRVAHTEEKRPPLTSSPSIHDIFASPMQTPPPPPLGTAITSILSTDISSKAHIGISGKALSVPVVKDTPRTWTRDADSKKTNVGQNNLVSNPVKTSPPVVSAVSPLASVSPAVSDAKNTTFVAPNRQFVPKQDKTDQVTLGKTLKNDKTNPKVSVRDNPDVRTYEMITKGNDLNRWLASCDPNFMNNSIFVQPKHNDGGSSDPDEPERQKPDFIRPYSFTPTPHTAKDGVSSSPLQTSLDGKRSTASALDIPLNSDNSPKKGDNEAAILPSISSNALLPPSSSFPTNSSTAYVTAAASLADYHAQEREKRLQQLLNQVSASKAFREMVHRQTQQRQEALKALGVGSEALLNELFPDMDSEMNGSVTLERGRSGRSGFASRSPSRGKQSIQTIPENSALGNTNDDISEAISESQTVDFSDSTVDAEHGDNMKELLNRLFELGMSGVIEEEAMLIPNPAKSATSASHSDSPTGKNRIDLSLSIKPSGSLEETLWRLCADRLEAATSAGYGEGLSYQQLLESSMASPTVASPKMGESGKIENSRGILKNSKSQSQSPRRRPQSRSAYGSASFSESMSIADKSGTFGASTHLNGNTPPAPGKNNSGTGIAAPVNRALSRRARRLAAYQVVSVSGSTGGTYHRYFGHEEPMFQVHSLDAAPAETKGETAREIPEKTADVRIEEEEEEDRESGKDISEMEPLAVSMKVLSTNESKGRYARKSSKNDDFEPITPASPFLTPLPSQNPVSPKSGISAIQRDSALPKSPSATSKPVKTPPSDPAFSLNSSPASPNSPRQPTSTTQPNSPSQPNPPKNPTSTTLPPPALPASPSADAAAPTSPTPASPTAAPPAPSSPRITSPLNAVQPAANSSKSTPATSTAASNSNSAASRPTTTQAPTPTEPISSLQIAELLHVPQKILLSSRHFPPRPMQVASADAVQQREKAIQELRQASNLNASEKNGKKIIPGLPPSLTVESHLTHNPNLPVLNLSYFAPPSIPEVAHSPETSISIPQLVSLFSLPVSQRTPQALRPLANMLRPLPFFSTLPSSLIALLLSHALCTQVVSGQVACPVKPPPGDLYILLDGNLSTNVTSTYRSSIGPGTCIGSLMYDPPAPSEIAPKTTQNLEQPSSDTTSTSLNSPHPTSPTLNNPISDPNTLPSPPLPTNTTQSDAPSSDVYSATTDSVILYLSPSSYRALLRNGLAVHLAKSLSALSHVPVLSTLPPLQLLEIARAATPLSLPPSSLILAQGTMQLAAGVYVLVEGSAVIARRTVKYVCNCKAGQAWRKLLARKILKGAVQGDALTVNKILNGDFEGLSDLELNSTLFNSDKDIAKSGHVEGPNPAVQQCKDPRDCPSPTKKTIVVDVGRLHAPCLIGEISVSTNTPREAHVYTETNALVLRIARPDYAKLIPMRVRQELVSYALKRNKYSSDALVKNTLRQQWEWGKLKQKLTDALLENQRLGLHR